MVTLPTAGSSIFKKKKKNQQFVLKGGEGKWIRLTSDREKVNCKGLWKGVVYAMWCCKSVYLFFVVGGCWIYVDSLLNLHVKNMVYQWHKRWFPFSNFLRFMWIQFSDILNDGITNPLLLIFLCIYKLILSSIHSKCVAHMTQPLS